ncbi:hypothetical protein [Pseudonocardia pini]|uniref:hypothetical protein n=1 Tax=Pseudonocardia pini TaxID=2758030 RepID=UPI0015F0B937|nr:hypothetical protein [Pseudonocardia pini]
MSDLTEHLSDQLSAVTPDDPDAPVTLDRSTAAAVLERLTVLGGMEADVRAMFTGERDASRSAEWRLRQQHQEGA